MHWRNSGFNIIEIMSIIALLGVIASVAIPAFNDYTERARINRAVGDISRISVEISRWKTDSADNLYPASLAAAGIAVSDPWGNPYGYLQISESSVNQRRLDQNHRPVNTDFDLYSTGPDGNTVAQFNGLPAHDDIVRARNGAFIGIAADY